jgi:hypothetical protein
MTKKLEELFNLPKTVSDDATAEDAQSTFEENQEVFKEIDEAIDKIDLALPGVKGLDASDDEMDELAKLAKDKFEDLMDLGMNVDSRFSGTIFQTAGVLLGHAITAKQAKLDKKLRVVDLQLKKLRLDHQMRQQTGQPAAGAVEGEGMVLDRNALLAEILKKPKQ